MDPEFDFDLEFEWDPGKSASNLLKHGIDFYSARAVFGDPHRIEVLSIRGEDREIRRIVTGKVGEEFFSIICTERVHATRIISVRKARRRERRTYGESQKAL